MAKHWQGNKHPNHHFGFEVFAAGHQGGDAITLMNESVAYLSGGRGRDTLVYLSSDGHGALLGGRGRDTLFGGDSDDLLSGGRGADRLHGGDGDDTLWGGRGNDAFLFSGKGDEGVDAVMDFQHGEDSFVLGNLGLLAEAFHIGTEAADPLHRIIYDDQTGTLYLDADGVGGADAVAFATVTIGTALDHTDFIYGVIGG